jgi:hypothetical protein
MSKFDFIFTQEQQIRFRSGDLMLDWSERYPMLFDGRDVAICRNQPDYHFFEWLGAVVLYEATGYLSLIEKYETKSHPRKLDVFRSSVSPDVFDHVLNNRTGVPDLFAYKADYSDWFFCEIKGGRDTLRDHQVARFREIASISGKQVAILCFNELRL